MSDQDDTVPEHDTTMDEKDMAILAAVRELYDRIDPVPVDLAERVRFAVTAEFLDAELSQLVETDTLAGVRSAPVSIDEPRTLLFEARTLTVMISLSRDRDRDEMARVDGWLVPEGEYRMELLTPHQRVATVSDHLGRFTVAEVPHGLCRMVIHPSQTSTPHSGVNAVMTPAFRIE